jgi:hypothetical protein
MPPNNEQSQEAREALRIAETFVSHPEVQCELAAALLEAEARGIDKGKDVLTEWPEEPERLRAEAQQLRGKGE